MLGRTSRRFLWFWLLLLFYFIGGFSSFIAFRRHSSFFREPSPGFSTHFILSAQLIAEWFAELLFQLSGLFRHSLTASATVLIGRFLPPDSFYFALISHILARFVTQMLAGAPHPGSSSVPALTKLSFPADAWSWTTDVVDRRPLVYQLHQWATTYKVTKLLNMFQPTYGCSKSYGKDYKQDLLRNIAWNCFNETTTSKLFKKAATPFVCSKQAAIIENNQCLMDKRCFWDLVIFLI